MPKQTSFVYRVHVDGVDRPMTPEEIEQYLATLPETTEAE